jgi:hypothetical protein
VKPAAERRHWQSVRADAYRLAHQARANAEAAVLEPPPVSSRALRAIPVAVDLEDAVDAITALSSARDAGTDSAEAVRELCGRLDALDRAAAAAETPPAASSR